MNLRFGALPYTLNFPSYFTLHIENNDSLIFTDENHFHQLMSSVTYQYYNFNLIETGDYQSIYSASLGAPYSNPLPANTGSLGDGYSTGLYQFEPSEISFGAVISSDGYRNIGASVNNKHGFHFIKLFHPVSFRADNSFCLNNLSKVPLDIEIFNSLLDQQTLPFNLCNTSKTKTTSNSFISITANVSGSVAINSHPLFEFKLLNLDDFITCSDTSVSDWTTHFFNNLTSPTLEIAVANGGCQFFGIAKHVKPMIASASFSGDTSYSGSFGYNPLVNAAAGVYAASHYAGTNIDNASSGNYYGLAYFDKANPNITPFYGQQRSICLLP